MICFRDMTFCNAPCGNREGCPRDYNAEQQDRAEAWWKSFKQPDQGPPIAMSNFSLHCSAYKPLDDEGAE